jgi:hypothetical protein
VANQSGFAGVQDLPFAASVGCCYQHVAGHLLGRLEKLMHTNKCFLTDMRERILEIIAMERRLGLQLPNPSAFAVGSAHNTVDKAASEQVLEAITAKASDDSTADDVARDHVKENTVGRWRRSIRAVHGEQQFSAMTALVKSALCPLPRPGQAGWMDTTAVQKLEQLCMILVMARAARVSAVVMFCTDGMVEYINRLLEAFEEQEYLSFGNLQSITSGMTLQQVGVNAPYPCTLCSPTSCTHHLCTSTHDLV